MHQRRILVVGLALVGLSLCSGCGQSDPLNRQSVSGTVTLDGQPLDQGTIEFHPVDGQAGTLSGGMVSGGTFEVPAEKGLAPGKYNVRIFATEASGTAAPPGMPGDAPQEVAEQRIPAKYNVETELTADVTAGGDNTFQFDLTTS